MKCMTTLDWLALALVLIGGLNWGLVGFFDYNIITVLLGKVPVIEKIVYAAVGLSALWIIFSCCKGKKK